MRDYCSRDKQHLWPVGDPRGGGGKERNGPNIFDGAGGVYVEFLGRTKDKKINENKPNGMTTTIHRSAA